jgi:hypothetical protein
MTPKLSFATIQLFRRDGYIDLRRTSTSPCETHQESNVKVIAIASVKTPLTPEQRQQIMPNEVPATLKLYLDGKIEQFWYRQDAPGVIFLMNVDSVDDASAAVNALPLAAQGFAKYELFPVGPLAPLGLLMQNR